MINSSFFAHKGQGLGYNRVLLEGNVVEEHDTYQCAHCNTTIFIKPSDPSPWCSCCDRQICKDPRCRMCVPFMKKLEREEARHRARELLWKSCDNV